jgi:hypothetical protein
MFFILVTSFMTQEQALTSSLIPSRSTPELPRRVHGDPADPYTWNTTRWPCFDRGHHRVVRARGVRAGADAVARRQFAFVAVLAT